MTLPIGVAEFYAGKSIFITGATGFMGIVLVEKLLRSCPDIKTLYLLMRTKKGLSPEERIQDYVNNEVFNRIQAECPKNLHKLRLVPGDVMEDQLGMSILDQEELQRECQIVFHCAACVRFDMFIRDAVEMNMEATTKMLEFAENMKKLEVFLYMSTAYCHDDLDVLEESLYPPKHSPQEIMAMVKWMDDEILKSIEDKLIHPLPNTYAYTKNLTEDIVAQYAGKFSIAIARPSIVTAAHQEPIPGWVNNLNGPTGLLVAGAKGVFRIMHTRKNVRPDVMPVDVAVNASIILAYTTGVERPKDIRVCNITNSGRNTMSWVDTTFAWHKYIQEFPFMVCLWYPMISYCETRQFYQIQALFLHWLPALLIDALITLFRRKPFMIKVQKRLTHGLELLAHYMTGQWTFKNDNFMALKHRISEKERKIFFTDYESIEQYPYIKNYVQGARKYCCKESPDNLPKARRQLKFLYYLHLTVKFIFLWWLLNIAYYFLKNLFNVL